MLNPLEGQPLKTIKLFACFSMHAHYACAWIFIRPVIIDDFNLLIGIFLFDLFPSEFFFIFHVAIAPQPKKI